MFAAAELAANFNVRKATMHDSVPLTRLSHEMNKHSSPQQIKDRLHHLLESTDNAVFIAEKKPIKGRHDDVVGYLQVHLQRTVHFPARVEVLSIVVERSYRAQGIGRKMLKEAESWASDQSGVNMVVAFVKDHDERAVSFYKLMGYRERTVHYRYHFLEKEL